MTEPELPDAPELEELERLFRLGDYRGLRDRAANLQKRALERDDSAAREKIDVLLARTRPDPTGAKIYLLAFVLLIAITWLTYSGALG